MESNSCERRCYLCNRSIYGCNGYVFARDFLNPGKPIRVREICGLDTERLTLTGLLDHFLANLDKYS